MRERYSDTESRCSRCRFPLVIVLLLAAGLSGCGSSADLDVTRRFQQAQSVFDAATSRDEFLEAASIYQQLIDEGFESGAVFYNQGNAFMRADEHGRAIAAYRQAKRYRPRDPLLDSNLAAALVQGTTASSGGSILDRILFWQDWLSYPEKFATTTFLLAAAVAASLIGLIAGKHSRFRLPAVACGLLAVVSGISTAIDWYRIEMTTNGVVVVDSVTARKGNGESYEPAFNKPLAEGTEFRVLSSRGDWLQIHVKAGDGWVPRSAAAVY